MNTPKEKEIIITTAIVLALATLPTLIATGAPTPLLITLSIITAYTLTHITINHKKPCQCGFCTGQEKGRGDQ